jgi:hypothetical protein
MSQEFDLAFAVEKVLFRLALLEGSRVPLARAFLELPLALEVFEHEGDKAADGTTVFKDEFGDFLTYEFKELASASGPAPAPPDDCPTCGRSSETPSGTPRGPLVCDPCFRAIKRLSTHDETTLERIRHFFKGEEEEDPAKVALVEHEIFFVALRLGGRELTHTQVAAQTRLPAAQVKERLERLAQRRYIRVGLVPAGDALAYRFPEGLSYPDTLWRRMKGALVADDEGTKPAKTKTTGPFTLRPRENKPPVEAPPPPPKLNIKVKDVRDRRTPRPPPN